MSRLPLALLLLAALSAPQRASAAPPDEALTLYEREKAALEAELSALKRVRQETERQRRASHASATAALTALREEWASLHADNLTLEEEARRLARQLDGAGEDAEAELAATLERAAISLSAHGLPLPAAHPPEERLRRAFSLAAEVLARNASITVDPEGGFFGADGQWTAGTVVRVGAVAALGLSADDKSAGVLVPADPSGALRLLADPSAEVAAAARALAAGTPAPLTPLFVFDPLDWHPIAIDAPAAQATPSRTLAETLAAAGPLAWPIAGLAFAAALLILAALLGLALWRRAWRQAEPPIAACLAAPGQHPLASLSADLSGAQGALVAAARRARLLPAAVRAEAFAAVVEAQTSRVERGLPFLKVIAAVAPLLGLLGTVMGMIDTFDSLTAHGAGDARLLSGGISQALLTTELGLLVAVPALLAHSLLASWADRAIDRIESRAVDWLVLVTSLDDGASPRAGGALTGPSPRPEGASPVASRLEVAAASRAGDGP